MNGRVLEEGAPMDTGGHNILASWAVAVAQAADARGLDSEAIFTRAGIDLSTARDPKTRFPAERMTVVYRLAEEAVHDLTFGLSIAEFVHPTSLHALGYSLFASSDLESFCRRIVRYFGLVTTNAVTHYEERGTECRLVMYPETGANIFAPQDAWLATILRFVRFIYRPDFDPVRVALRRPVPAISREKFSEYFGAPIEFGHEMNVLVFDPVDMKVHLPAANAELAQLNDRVVMSLLSRIDRHDIVTQVRAAFSALLPSGDCSRGNVALRLNVSERTLQNRLLERGTSYRALLNETRHELAEQYMDDGQYTVSEVAFLLGFSEVSSFSRAFRAWTGDSPSTYRERRLVS